jgi:predicted RNA binding protein YcfA (HicA-like mRNA interferase family)
MGKRKYLPLTPAEVIANLEALGFKLKHTVGDHRQYERLADAARKRSIVTVDIGIKEFGEFLLASMIRQSNFSRDEFYGATKKTARRAGVGIFFPEPAGD